MDTTSTATVARLTEEIFTKNRNIFTRRGIAPNELSLWKLSTPLQIVEDDNTTFDELLEAFFLNPKSVASKLNPAFDVSDYFSVNPPKRHLHLIVQVPDIREEKRHSVPPLQNLSISSSRRRIGYTASSLRDKQKKNIDTVNAMPGPSSAARLAYLINNNDCRYPVIRNLRPSHARGPPISIFHGVFASFLRESANATVQMSSQYLDTLSRFMAAATAFYGNEMARQNAMSPLLGELIGCRFKKYKTTNGARLDDASLVDEIFCTLIAEYKNDIGTGGCDGSIQVSFGHAKWAAQEKVC